MSKPPITPLLDPQFEPASLWNRAYRERVALSLQRERVALVLERPDGTRSVWQSNILPQEDANRIANERYVERALKFLLWQKGGAKVRVAGPAELTAYLQKTYAPKGTRAFDHTFMGERVYRESFVLEPLGLNEVPEPRESDLALGRNLDGCRIGFDLGGSDRKCAALIDGKVVHSEEVKWDPYFQKDPAYHLKGIEDSLQRAAMYLPRVDAIGGSAAGVYVNNEVRVASLFRGVSEEDFEQHVRRIFFTLKERWNNIPFEVVNDGEVTALAGAMSLDDNGVLGISMGTSLAAGYVDPEGHIKPWLNELAFAPIDYRKEAPADEWSGDLGCGVQYFSQQGVARLLPYAGFTLDSSMPFAERLEYLQERMSEGDDRAPQVYETIGVCFGYAIAHYADFYDFRHLLVLGRVTSGEGGNLILEQARRVLDKDFPELSGKLALRTPDEKDKRHGQAVAAASLPALS